MGKSVKNQRDREIQMRVNESSSLAKEIESEREYSEIRVEDSATKLIMGGKAEE